ncbi:5-cytosine rRNA methyltransferase nsun-4 [Caenorhabditis elegans]|uniref:Isoform c of 5-cytosine rRNA methyltransferase nsun-4 n=2 Tax=Caenorhabditis TaxID=6237 RepID=Q95XR2-3|nr:5-methylcytosine rRNA methyltransferase nsun-4 [Caenorhabditis elegans]CDO41157.1 5-methylcytosine rRNA methyltransferase nsun-4 [Caenorhabditis elegans]|eukprot:NP_001293365.1 Nop2 (NOP2)/SUN domain family member [Caenorhabditis elegans]
MTSSGLYRFHDTPLGALVVPFLPSNFGPMYICKLTRLQ